MYPSISVSSNSIIFLSIFYIWFFLNVFLNLLRSPIFRLNQLFKVNFPFTMCFSFVFHLLVGFSLFPPKKELDIFLELFLQFFFIILVILADESLDIFIHVKIVYKILLKDIKMLQVNFTVICIICEISVLFKITRIFKTLFLKSII